MDKDSSILDNNTHQIDSVVEDNLATSKEDDAFNMPTLESINRMKTRVRNARIVMKARDRLAADCNSERIDDFNNIATHFIKNSEKEIKDYQEQKTAFKHLIEERKVLKQQ